MKKTYLNDIKQKELSIHQANIGYYKLFNRFILPYIPKSDIEFWTRIQCTQMCQVEKQSSKVYLFYDKFFILNHCFTTDTKDSSIYEAELNLSFSKGLTESQIKSYAFNETIFFIARYKSLLNLTECYQQLKKQMSRDDCIRSFNHSKLTTIIFINLVGSSETSYHGSRGKTPLEESYDE
ncbi:hypothetical protein ACTXMK_09795 [Psychrobacter celer]|uniref:hypothetical protein n=1 Tax=Psychrobacter celer TaxID=306572 RepID=UPI003FD11CD7